MIKRSRGGNENSLTGDVTRVDSGWEPGSREIEGPAYLGQWADGVISFIPST